MKAFDVVTAEGDIRHCDATEHEYLCWTSRGAGPGRLGVLLHSPILNYLGFPAIFAIRSNDFAASTDDAWHKLVPLIEGGPGGTVVAEDLFDNSIVKEYGLADVVNPRSPQYIADDFYFRPSLYEREIATGLKRPFTRFIESSVAFFEPLMPVSRTNLLDMALSPMSDYHIRVYARYDSASEDILRQEWINSETRELAP